MWSYECEKMMMNNAAAHHQANAILALFYKHQQLFLAC
jgi:hypothetical protein